MFKRRKNNLRPKYDVYTELAADHARINAEIVGMAGDEISGDALHSALQGVHRVYSDYILYATIGKDRKKLGPEWAEKARAQAQRSIDMARSFS